VFHFYVAQISTCEKNIPFLGAAVILLFFLISSAEIHGDEKVSWKTFKDKNDVFTIKYPSNWAFGKYYEDSSAPINIYFYYQGHISLAELAIYAQESLFTNSSDLVDSYPVYLQSEPNYEVLETTQCGEYVIKNVSACDMTVTYKDTRLEGDPVVKHMIIGTIDENGVEYIIEYFVTEDLFEHFLPVTKEMIRSFDVTHSQELSPNGSGPRTEDSPDMPPISKPGTIEKI
jgi:hypothetical protein